MVDNVGALDSKAIKALTVDESMEGHYNRNREKGDSRFTKNIHQVNARFSGRDNDYIMLKKFNTKSDAHEWISSLVSDPDW